MKTEEIQFIVFCLLGFIAVGGIGYYFRRIKFLRGLYTLIGALSFGAVMSFFSWKSASGYAGIGPAIFLFFVFLPAIISTLIGYAIAWLIEVWQRRKTRRAQ